MTITRRTSLAALIASPLVAASASAQIGGSVEPNSEDPILPIYRDWCRAHTEWYRLAELPENRDWDAPESIAADEETTRAFLKMVDMTPVSKQGIAALAHVLWETAGPSITKDHPEYAEQCAEPENKMILAIYRAASGDFD